MKDSRTFAIVAVVLCFPLFAKARTTHSEWAIVIGAGEGTVSGKARRFVNVQQAALQWTHVFRPTRAERLGIGLEAIPAFYVRQGQATSGFGANLLLNYTWDRGRWSSYALAGVGALRTYSEVPSGASRHNFTPQAGIGMRRPITTRTTLAFEYRFHHISNGGRFPKNPGINSHLLLMRYSWK